MSNSSFEVLIVYLNVAIGFNDGNKPRTNDL